MYEILRPKIYVTVVKIPLLDVINVDVLMGKGKRELMSSAIAALSVKPDFVINGGLFNMVSGDTLSTVQDDGQTIAKDICSDFGMYVNRIGKLGFGLFEENLHKEFIGGSPSLIINGKINMDIRGLDTPFLVTKHPRSALGMNNTHLFLVTIDGRRFLRPGMTCQQLADYMLSLGCTESINLDGGGSSRLAEVLDDELVVLNHVTEDRAVDNFICISLDESTIIKKNKLLHMLLSYIRDKIKIIFMKGDN